MVSKTKRSVDLPTAHRLQYIADTSHWYSDEWVCYLPGWIFYIHFQAPIAEASFQLNSSLYTLEVRCLVPKFKLNFTVWKYVWQVLLALSRWDNVSSIGASQRLDGTVIVDFA